ncbi:MAG: hypothetical protein WD397_06970 [Wenzhouxiangellaceae bacterium]
MVHAAFVQAVGQGPDNMFLTDQAGKIPGPPFSRKYLITQNKSFTSEIINNKGAAAMEAPTAIRVAESKVYTTGLDCAFLPAPAPRPDRNTTIADRLVP